MAKGSRGQLFLGFVLVAVGAALLLARMHVVASAPAFLLALGTAFSLYGVFARRLAPVVGGCIFLGLGMGIFFGDQGYRGLSMVSWHMVGLGVGFILIFLLALVLGLGRQLWALIVGSILVLVGAFPNLKALVSPEVLIIARTYWPVLLVVLGLVLVVKGLKR